jgi:hypothetical protein
MMENRFSSSPRTMNLNNGGARDNINNNINNTTTSHGERSSFARRDRDRDSRTRDVTTPIAMEALGGLSREGSRRNSRIERGYEDERTIRGLEDLQREAAGIEDAGQDPGEMGGEDVFLNLARSNSVSSYTDNPAYRAERRRVGPYSYFLPCPYSYNSILFCFVLFFLHFFFSFSALGPTIDYSLMCSHASRN